MEPDNEGLINLNCTGQCVMELIPYMEEKLRDLFNLETEMLQGTREPLDDGRARLTFTIKDQAKGRMVVDFIMMLNDLPSARVQWLN